MEKKFSQSSDEIQALKTQLDKYKKTCLILKDNSEKNHEKLESKNIEVESL